TAGCTNSLRAFSRSLHLFLQNVHCDAPLVDSAALPLEHRAVYGPPAPSPVYGTPGLLSGGGGSGGLIGGGGGGGGGDDPWPLSASNDSPQIKHLQVQCEKTHMRVNIEFDRPFYGMIFSKGFYSDPHCVHLKPGTGHLSATFEIFLNSCGMSSSANHNAASFGGPTPSGSYVENTIIIQYDPYVQEVWDQARKLRCTWYDFYEKAVTFRPFQVDMLHAVTANFLGDNLQCWMQIQVGKGPWASEVSGIVKIGQTMTMVLAIKDDENKFDMLVRNCVAHDGKRAPIQLVDQHGCVVRPKIMSKFQKIKNFGPSASVVSFAYFQAFKFPDSMNVHFQCVIQVCRYNCPEPKCAGGDYGLPALTGNGISGEYGAPGPLSGEYGPPHLSEYGVPPAAYPDPRHPSDASGAYSENQDSVVPAPQAQTSANSAENKSDGPVNDNNRIESQPQSSNPTSNDIHDHINMPPPPPPGQTSYVTVTKQQQQQQKKDDGLSGENSGNLVSLGGRPRSVEGLDDLRGVRRRRDTMSVVIRPRIYKRDAQEMTDVNTERIIQVVAPGDVNFALNNASGNETVVIQSQRTVDPETICMSVPSFVGGLVMLLLVLAVASLVAAFLFVRVRHFDRKGTSASRRPHFVLSELWT
uniref:ZP domain-containing protein n=1 Tax=Anopheles christyi TaxID=43041 RepID=A0A182KG64_9DIPT